MSKTPDVRITNHGSIVIFYLVTKRARVWVEENVQGEYQTWGRDGLVVEHRYAHALSEGMTEEGLVLA